MYGFTLALFLFIVSIPAAVLPIALDVDDRSELMGSGLN
jgi:hypothetical protein